MGGVPMWSGLHAGAPLGVGSPGRVDGAVGCLLTTDAADGPTHLLTAGHLFPPSPHQEARTVWAALPGAAPRAIGHLVSNFLDLPPGWRGAIDVALVALGPEGQRVANGSGGVGPRLRAVGRVPPAGPRRVRGRALQVTEQRLSDPVLIRAGAYRATLWAPARPRGYRVGGVLRTTPLVTRAGDSGSILCAAEDPGIALGLVSGAFGSTSLFEPLPRALARAGEVLGMPVRLFVAGEAMPSVVEERREAHESS